MMRFIKYNLPRKNTH